MLEIKGKDIFIFVLQNKLLKTTWNWILREDGWKDTPSKQNNGSGIFWFINWQMSLQNWRKVRTYPKQQYPLWILLSLNLEMSFHQLCQEYLCIWIIIIWGKFMVTTKVKDPLDLSGVFLSFSTKQAESRKSKKFFKINKLFNY